MALKPKEDPTLLKAKSDALRLLAFAPRSVMEMRKRLALKHYPPFVIEEVIGLLTRNGFLDDEKFAKVYVQSRVYGRPSGKRQIAFRLRQKGLPEDIVKKTLDDLQDFDEQKIAKDLVFSRFRRMQGISAQKKQARLYGFLKRRGFPEQVVRSVLAELFKNGELR